MKMKKAGLLFVILAVLLAAAVPMEGKAMGNKIAKLCEAIERGDNDEAIRLAEGIRDLNAQSSSIPWLVGLFEGEVTTPLVKACETGNAVMIPWLLEHGARTDYDRPSSALRRHCATEAMRHTRPVWTWC